MPSKHVLVKDLRPGMFIVEPETKLHPFLYVNSGLIIDWEEIDNIMKQGYLEAYYDPDRSIVEDFQNERVLKDVIALKEYVS